MAGINRHTGKVLDGWEHVRQSLLDIFTTRIGTRVMRRDYGSDIPTLIDRPGEQDIVLEVAMAAGEAIDKWEPRFKLKFAGVTDGGPDGVFQIEVVGDYYPRGHLGDFTIVEDDKSLQVRLR